MSRPVRIGNFSGAMGDRFGALEEMVTAEPKVDVAIGDSMAEITMSLVAGGTADHPGATQGFYAEYFLSQVRPLLETIAERGVKVVTNAGIFNPAGLAETLGKDIADAGLDLKVAYVRGDDLLPRFQELLDKGELAHLDSGAAFADDPADYVAVNAYLGGWGIAEALEGGADIVVTGRVADASLVLGPAAWWHGWKNDELNKVAGAVAAAHIIECGPQAVGGNFSGFAAVPDNTRLGFPIAEVAEDGTSVITKRAQDGGAVTVDTVTAQLMYEIQGPLYRTPDVTLRVDEVSLTQQGPDRVLVSGAKGLPASLTTKVGMHRATGYRAGLYLFPTGLQIEEKIDVLRRQAEDAAKGLDLDDVLVTVLGQPIPDPKDQYESTVAVRVAFSGPTAEGVKAFGARFPSYGLGGIPGFYVDFLQGMATVVPQARIEYWPGLVHQSEISQEVVFADGRVEQVPPVPMAEFPGQPVQPPFTANADFGPTAEVPLGTAVFTRVGDKGGNANLGAWTPDPEAYDWLRGFLTVDELTRLLDLDTDVRVERYEMPRLHGVSFVLGGYFGPSGSSNLALDQIGKALGEFLRARHVQVPVTFIQRGLAGDEPHEIPAA